MASLQVCPLSRLPETLAGTKADHLVTLVRHGTGVERPPGIAADRHLVIGVSDIVAPLDGHVLPTEAHIAPLIAFARAWDRRRPLVIHCYAGISRSTAAAYIAACALNPERDEGDLAQELRRAAPSATPNPLFVEIADRLLGRDSRMNVGIGAIGQGAEAFEGTPFRLDIP